MGKDYDGDGAEKLPIARVSFGSFVFGVKNYATCLRVGWFPFLLCFALTSGGSILEGALRERVGGDDGLAVMMLIGGLNSLVFLGGSLLLVPALSAWLRLTIQGPLSDGRYPLWRFGHEERRLAWYVLQVSLVFILIWLPFTLVSTALNPGESAPPDVALAIFTAGFVLALVTIYFCAVTAPAYGAAQMGQPATLVSSWRMTRGRGLRMFLASLLSWAILITLFVALLTANAGLFSDAPSFSYGFVLYLEGGVAAVVRAAPSMSVQEFIGLAATIVILLAFYLLATLAGTIFCARIYLFLRKARSNYLEIFD